MTVSIETNERWKQRYLLRERNGEGFLRMAVAVPGERGVLLHLAHTTCRHDALSFCTRKAAQRFAVAVATHYPNSLHGRYEVLPA
jgi:hypothetical protein